MAGQSRDPARVRRMFGSIARRYDFLNHLLSANLDRRWRRRAARALPAEPGLRVLDLCGGTGDLSLEVARQGREPLVVCCDFSRPMLARAAAKFRRRGRDGSCVTLEADGLRLPFADGSFHAVTVAFGVRNLADLELGFREMLRVLQPGGRLVVLEFSQPTAPLMSGLYRFYLRHVLPRIGNRVSGRDGPYRYLARTIAGFPSPDLLAGRIRDAGFAACGWDALSGGIVCVHTAFKGLAPGSGPQSAPSSNSSTAF